MNLRARLLSPSVLALVGVLLFFGISSVLHKRWGNNARKKSCLSNLNQIALSFAQYRRDSDGIYPRVAWNRAVKNRKSHSLEPPYGWADGIQPYIKCRSCFICPSELHFKEEWISEEQQFTDYWMNANLSGRKTASTRTLLFGDGDGMGNARYSLQSFPAHWQKMPENSWFKRHLGGANYAFADGHVKWLKPEQIVAGEATFAP